MRVSKDILPSIFYKLDHISSKHGRQLQEHIADSMNVSDRNRKKTKSNVDNIGKKKSIQLIHTEITTFKLF